MKTHRTKLVFTPIAVGMVCAGSMAHAAAPPGAPCSARADAVIANTGSVSSNSQSLVDSYQSSLGAYGGANVGASGNVQSGTTIVANGGVIHGTETQHTPGSLAVAPVPAGATNLPLGSSAPGSLNINNAAQSITLAPGSYVAANVNVNFPGAITISPPGPVLIWVTGSLNLGGNENANGVPDNLQFLVTSATSVSVNSNGKLFGFIYAPASPVNVNSAIFGGVVGSTVTLNPGAAVHFDQNSTCPAVGATAIASGGEFACAINLSGGVECWGSNSSGQLGDNGVSSSFCIGQGCSSVPVQVVGLTSGATAVSGGQGAFAQTGTACAIAAGGALLCWGDNGDGQLGNNTTTSSAVPVPVLGLTSGVTAVSVGFAETCAIAAGGAVMCWGRNFNGDLGNGTGTDSSVPTQVVGLTSGVKSVSVGVSEACAITGSGAVMCWGNNAAGQLGDNTTDSSAVPVQVVGLTSGATAVSVEDDFACAITGAGGVVCWGSNLSGDLGSGSPAAFSPVPVQVTGLTSGVIALSGVTSTCALTVGGDVLCWGATPTQAVGLTSGITAISNGCALTSAGDVLCSGDNTFGELGNDTFTSSATPVAVVGF